MTTEMIRVEDLTPYEHNARHHEPVDIDAIAKSIEAFGFNDPVGVWGPNNIIVEGHGRVMAAKQLGLKEVPCIRLDDLTDEQRRAYGLAHNKTAELSTWDAEMLPLELQDLPTYDMTAFGFDDVPAAGDADDPVIEEDDFDEDTDEVEARVKPGDLYLLGGVHRLICGDATDYDTIAKLLDGQKPDIVLTDPPYGMRLDTDFSTIKGSLKSIGRKNNTSGNKYDRVIGDNDDFKPELISSIFKSFARVKEIFLFGADYYAELLPDKNDGSWLVWDKRKESQADAIGSEFELIWSKTKHKRRMLRHDWFGFLSSGDPEDARHRVHPTQKPVSLLADILSQWGADAVSVVDVYGGSGSTLIACEQTGRQCFMCELDPHYCDVIIARWEKLTGKKAELVRG